MCLGQRNGSRELHDDTKASSFEFINGSLTFRTIRRAERRREVHDDEESSFHANSYSTGIQHI